MPPSNGVTVIRSLGQQTKVSDANKITAVELLGHGPVKFVRKSDQLEITLPEQLPNQWALAFKITVDGELVQRQPLPPGTEVPYSKTGFPRMSYRQTSTSPVQTLFNKLLSLNGDWQVSQVGKSDWIPARHCQNASCRRPGCLHRCRELRRGSGNIMATLQVAGH